ncbi:hypothetical protein C8J57DRAFT_1282381 [Mycena rebaudengoi]|nr:hypothetical protein C8J57DRAFT_1282381 [Mycena rebaudengoi]
MSPIRERYPTIHPCNNPTPPRPTTHRLLYRGALVCAVAPSLRLLGPTKLKDIWMDESWDIHPNATLSRIYFENTFCLDPAAVVTIGDSVDPGTMLMVIFARPEAKELHLIVARITPAPPPPSQRLPRPDDPTPRRPPIRFDRSASTGSNLFVKKRNAASLGSSVRLGEFMIPDPPRDEDVFGFGADVENKGKRKRAEEPDVASQMEKANKTIIKQSAIHLLPIPKTHPEYKEVYGYVYRGVIFALRAEMKTSAVDLKSVERLVKAHVGMYVGVDARTSKVQNKM